MKRLIIEHRVCVACVFNLKKVKKVNYERENGVWYMIVKVGKEEHKFEPYNSYRIKII